MHKFTIHVHYQLYSGKFDEYVFIETETNEPTSQDIFAALKNKVDNINDIEYIAELLEGHVKPIHYNDN
jgi:hypothetical protein